MIIFDGAFLMGVAAVLTAIGTLWRTGREQRRERRPDECKKKEK